MTQWDDPNNKETRAYPRQGQPPGYGQGYGQNDPYRPNDAYRANDPYGQQAGYPTQPETAAQRRARFEDSTKNPFGAASDQAFGIVSTVLALLGGILGIVTLTGLDWFRGGISFSQFDDLLNSDARVPTGFSSAYFGWLAWVFLIVGVIAAVMASFPSPALRAFRVIGTVIGFAAAGLSFLALQQNSGTYLDVLKATRIGFYLMVIAYLMIGIGAAIGPRKV